jgi:succinate dehydrogenase/fumarate reductase-like Fe-S protein
MPTCQYTTALAYRRNMKKKECPSCAMEIDAKAKECPICGYEFPATNKVYQLVAILLIILFILYFIL